MELHTLGVDAGYTQNDVRELARDPDGLDRRPAAGRGPGFAERLHDNGDKVLLGKASSPAGEQEGEAAIRMLARHPCNRGETHCAAAGHDP